MSQSSSHKHPTDVEEGEINEEAPLPTHANGYAHHQQHPSRHASSYDSRRRRSSLSPSPYEPRKRSRRMSNEGNGSDDVMFEEYERLARRRPPSHDRPPSPFTRRDSAHSRPRSRSRHQRERKPSSYRDHASPYSGDTHHDRKHARRYDDYDRDNDHDRTRSRRHRSSSRDFRSRSQSRHYQDRQPRHASPPVAPRSTEVQPPKEEPKAEPTETMIDEDFEIKDEQEKQKEEERLIEERRKRRQMILERYKSTTPKATSESPSKYSTWIMCEEDTHADICRTGNPGDTG